MTTFNATRFAWLCALTILLSAFLLFQVQPVISKTILPWFGGGPAVWTTCMLFFQLLLLGGYAYAHWLPMVGSTKRQVIVHVSLLTLAVLLLPIIPNARWKPEDGAFPTSRIMLLLLANVAAPYFLLSSTGPLVQRWFSLGCPDKSPYRLYSLSNLGSLAALLSYPFVFEPMFDTTSQGLLWSAAFVIFAGMCGTLAITIYRSGIPLESQPNPDSNREATHDAEIASHSPLFDRFLWLLFPTLGSIALLAVTNHLCQDVAVFPFLWIAPLALYLVSFIICFDNPRWYWRPGFALTAAISVGMLTVFMHHYSIQNFLDDKGVIRWLKNLHISLNLEALNDNIRVHASVYLVAMFSICMLCHGELVRRKPASRYLTSFYLMTSAGGALGGIFVALICPEVFSSFRELNIILAMGFILAAVVMVLAALEAPPPAPNAPIRGGRQWLTSIVAFFLILVALPVIYGQWRTSRYKPVVAMRNFYGSLRVEDEGTTENEWDLDEERGGRQLLNGRILHGYQFLQPMKRNLATTYFTPRSGIGVALSNFPRQTDMRVGVVGLGAGTLAAYAELGDVYRFYEINPQVIKVANEQFTFLKDSEAAVTVVAGDARLSLEREESQQFDVFALDAFSGDAIPVHLLTSEAIAIYMRHLRPDGVLAVHISNLHLDLLPVVVGLARQQKLHVLLVKNGTSEGNSECSSDWVLLTRNATFRNHAFVQSVAEEIGDEFKNARIWTDKYSNLLQILK